MRRGFGTGGFVTRRRGLCGALVVPAVLAACGGGATRSSTSLVGIHKIEHVIVIMQENRSFDDYFGTFPGADGIPMAHGIPTVCVPDPANGGCVRPYPDHADVNGGGPHGAPDARAAIDDATMDAFVRTSQRAHRDCAEDPHCSG